MTMPAPLGSLCVYCGSSTGTEPALTEAAAAVGRLVAERGWRLVYGGGRVGLMGVVADAALAAGGEVVGVIPERLMRAEVAHAGLSELVVVDSMHARKARMALEAGAFLALPGGYGTLEELFEALTWNQLGLHTPTSASPGGNGPGVKPCGLLDVGGFYEPLLEWADGAVRAGLLKPGCRDLILSDTDPAALLDRLAAWEPKAGAKWDRAGG